MQTLIEQKTKAEHLVKLFIEYLENRWEYTRLVAAEKATSFTTTAISALIIGFFSGLIVLFLSLGLALYLGQTLGNSALGFFIVGLVYVVLMVFAVLFIKPSIERKISTTIINALDNEEEPQQ